MAKLLTVICPKCRTTNEIETGFMKKNQCFQCGAKLGAGDAVTAPETKLIVCANCHETIAWDPARGDKCPRCSHSLAKQDKERQISCPNCSAVVRYQAEETGDVSCPNCSKHFSPAAVRSKLEALLSADAADIHIPEGGIPAGKLFVKHDSNMFAENARVIAAPGTMAVVVQGTTVQGVVDGSSVRFSDMNLASDMWNYDGTEVKFVSADVYYMRSKFNQSFRFGGLVTLQMPYNDVAEVPYFNNDCSIRAIIDPVAFIQWVGVDKCLDVSEADFGMKRVANGSEVICEYSNLIREQYIFKVAGNAMRQVCAVNNITANRLHQYSQQVMENIETMANDRLAEIGLQVSVSATGTVAEPTIKHFVGNAVVASLTDPFDWATEPFIVHPVGNPMATVTMRAKGSMDVSVSDENALRSSVTWNRWSNDANIARRDILRFVDNSLTMVFPALVQQVIMRENPTMHMLSLYNGAVAADAALILNTNGAYIQQHGLFASDVTVKLEIVDKSETFKLMEKSATLPTELALTAQIRDAQRDFETSQFIKEQQALLTRAQSANQVKIGMMNSNAEVKNAENADQIQNLKLQEELAKERERIEQEKEERELERKRRVDEMIRRCSYEAWCDDQAQADRALASEMRRERLEQQHHHSMDKADAAHKADLERLAQEVAQSNLTFRQKMDAYARIQRNLAHQDKLEQDAAAARSEADKEAYAADVALKLNEKSRKVFQDLNHSEKLREEELQKTRFAREMEQRRQELAEQMAHLDAEFQKSQALAKAEEARRQSESELATLKLMLDYLAKDSANQITAQRLENLRAQAQREWRDQQAARAQEKADAAKREQQAAEQQMADRAYELVQQMNAMQHQLDMVKASNLRAYNQGRAMAEARTRARDQASIDSLKSQMEKLQRAVKATIGRNDAPASPLGNFGKALGEFAGQVRNGFVSVTGAGQPASPYGAAAPSGYGQPAAGGYGAQPGMAGVITCSNCGRQYNLGTGRCPFCKK